jgi:predicted oxidoreductase
MLVQGVWRWHGKPVVPGPSSRLFWRPQADAELRVPLFLHASFVFALLRCAKALLV